MILPLAAAFAAGVAQAQVPSSSGRESERGVAPDVPEVRVLTLLSGRVQTGSGEPAAGAVVLSSAGGETVTGTDGSFRLELALPAEAEGLQLTAVRGAGADCASASARVAVVPGSTIWSGTLTLASGGSCQPRW